MFKNDFIWFYAFQITIQVLPNKIKYTQTHKHTHTHAHTHVETMNYIPVKYQ